MKFKYKDVVNEPRIIEHSILRCYVHEEFKLRTGDIYQADLGFDLELLPRVHVLGNRADDVFVFNVCLPNIWLINFSLNDITFGKGDFLVDLSFGLNLTLRQ